MPFLLPMNFVWTVSTSVMWVSKILDKKWSFDYKVNKHIGKKKSSLWLSYMLGHIKVSVISNLFPLTFSPIINSLLTYSGVEYQLRLRVNLHLPRTFLVDIQKNWYSNDFINSYEVEIHSVGDFLFFFFFFFTFGVLICTWCMHWAPSLVWSQSKSSQICCYHSRETVVWVAI